MACGTRTVYPGKRNKELSSTLQPPEEGWSVQWLKCDKHGDKDEDNSPKNLNVFISTLCGSYLLLEIFTASLIYLILISIPNKNTYFHLSNFQYIQLSSSMVQNVIPSIFKI